METNHMQQSVHGRKTYGVILQITTYNKIPVL